MYDVPVIIFSAMAVALVLAASAIVLSDRKGKPIPKKNVERLTNFLNLLTKEGWSLVEFEEEYRMYIHPNREKIIAAMERKEP